DDLGHEVMEAALIRCADIHAGAAADGLQSLEDLDVGRSIVIGLRAAPRAPAHGRFVFSALSYHLCVVPVSASLDVEVEAFQDRKGPSRRLRRGASGGGVERRFCTPTLYHTSARASVRF